MISEGGKCNLSKLINSLKVNVFYYSATKQNRLLISNRSLNFLHSLVMTHLRNFWTFAHWDSTGRHLSTTQLPTLSDRIFLAANKFQSDEEFLVTLREFSRLLLLFCIFRKSLSWHNDAFIMFIANRHSNTVQFAACHATSEWVNKTFPNLHLLLQFKLKQITLPLFICVYKHSLFGSPSSKTHPSNKQFSSYASSQSNDMFRLLLLPWIYDLFVYNKINRPTGRHKLGEI